MILVSGKCAPLDFPLQDEGHDFRYACAIMMYECKFDRKAVMEMLQLLSNPWR